MKIAVIILAVLLIGGGVYYFTRDNATEPAETNNTQTTPATEKKTETPKSETSSQPGAYVDYSSTVIASTKGTKILFFHAPWCPQCRSLEASIKSTDLPDGVTIIKVDYDSNQTLRQKYGVTIQTTLVRIDDNGNLVEKYVAYDQPNFAAVEANLL